MALITMGVGTIGVSEGIAVTVGTSEGVGGTVRINVTVGGIRLGASVGKASEAGRHALNSRLSTSKVSKLIRSFTTSLHR